VSAAPACQPEPAATSWADRLAAAVAGDDWPGTTADKRARAIAADPFLWAHPERIARDRAHQVRQRGACANDLDPTEPCDCPPDRVALTGRWAGLARMVAARAAVGQPLNELDRQALGLDPGAPQ
jgi:hypothetical protein